MRERFIEWFGGIVAWTRAVPERVVRALERATGFPPGFWYVLFLSIVTALVATVVTVAAVYQHYNRPRRTLRVGSTSDSGLSGEVGHTGGEEAHRAETHDNTHGGAGG